jgi:RHS repeat-associated protein
VFFDNLSVQHKQGPLLEENHYYPYGLSMEGLSDKAIKTNYAENKLRYNSGSELQNKEFSDGTGWEMYETQYRGYDPQIGRFGEIDPLADISHFSSTYEYAGNNPVLMDDPTGLFRRYQQDPTLESTSPNNTAPNFGGPSINQINQQIGFDDGMNNPGDAPTAEEGGGSNNYAFADKNGAYFEGIYAENFMSGLENHIKNADINGNWVFTAETNKNGDWGYWDSFSFTSSEPTTTEDGIEQLAGVGIGQRFVSLDAESPNNETTTFFVQISDLKHNDFLGGEYSLKTYAGVTIGKNGDLITMNGGFTLDKNEKISAYVTIDKGIMSMLVSETGIETGLVIKGTSYTSTLISTDGSYSISWGNTNDDDHIALLQTQSWTPSTIEKILMMSPVFAPVAPGIPVPGF